MFSLTTLKSNLKVILLVISSLTRYIVFSQTQSGAVVANKTAIHYGGQVSFRKMWHK